MRHGSIAELAGDGREGVKEGVADAERSWSNLSTSFIARYDGPLEQTEDIESRLTNEKDAI